MRATRSSALLTGVPYTSDLTYPHKRGQLRQLRSGDRAGQSTGPPCPIHCWPYVAFRHLILEIDGCTKRPYSYSGAIGLLLKDCEKTPVLKFDQIDCTLQPLDLKDIKKLSTDQQYCIASVLP
ncbi:hypothetical protein AVEN_252574-1 [Araneus ventricosus]|uniref:Uncharacterized protein n=1 Tax=Araneus ventricosus TaxID=182803 RepID=A0A4Y2ASH0_ARAVE|nr:hypothetical protein AVEN_252574-1 [Araneus ventricosus]